jgi:tetratricopeptide (TPR) repeat protein
MVVLLSVTAVHADPRTLLRAGRADEALAALLPRIEKDPTDAEALHLISRVHYQLGQWDDAIRAAEKAVHLKPDNSEYHLWLGRAYGMKAESNGPVGALLLVRKVKAEFEKAVALDARNLAAAADLAEFYTEAPAIMGGDRHKARLLADQVMQIDAAQGHTMRAMIEANKKDPHAEDEFKAALAAGANQARHWINLAAYYRERGRLDDMEAAIQNAWTAPRRENTPLFDGAALLLRAGRNFPGAIQMLRAYLAPDVPEEDGPAFQAHLYLGQVLESQGDKSTAADEYRASLALASRYKPAQDALLRISR